MTFKKFIVKKLKEKADVKKSKILFIDGIDDRAIEAAIQHKEDDVIEPILLYVTEKDIPKRVKEKNVLTISLDTWKESNESLAQRYFDKRKGKESMEQALKAIKERTTFAMLLLDNGDVDGVIGGLEDPTSVILRAGFKVIGPKSGIKTISSVMIMEKGQDWLIFTDISVNIEPTKEQLSEIAINALDFGQSLDLNAKPAFLSFSTSGSAIHDKSTLISEATNLFNQSSKVKAIGEVQFDTALSEAVRNKKYTKDKTFEGSANIFIFPDLNAGNIGYKIAQRMGGYGAIGPIITGINKPLNDLSRGATKTDVYNTALITALQASK